MRKTPIIVTIVLISLASVYALVSNLLPDTPYFPRVPMGNGTIGGTIASILGVTDLANYAGDGTTKNATMLSGVTSTGYLRSSGACGATKVWTSLGAGTPTCADKSSILASMGTVDVLSGTVTAYHADGTFEILTSGTGILEGDIIKTSPGSTVTIAFADYSILRVGDDSTVSLDVGTQSGMTLAYAILENGSLWGRVLSETGGYYIGRNDLIVGVRGTSVSFTQSNPTVAVVNIIGHWKISKVFSGGVGDLTILQSSTNGIVGTVSCTDSAGTHEFPIGTGGTLHFLSTITTCLPGMISAGHPITDFYTNTGIANNVVADIEYMSGVLSTGTLTLEQRNKINTEYTRSQPTTTLEKKAICPPDEVGKTKIFWDSLIHMHIAPCQRTEVLAIADYSNATTKTSLFLSNGVTLIENTGGMTSLGQPTIGYTESMIPLLDGDWKIHGTMHTPGSFSSSSRYLLSISGATTIIRIYFNVTGGDRKLYLSTGGGSANFNNTVAFDTDYDFTLEKSGVNLHLTIDGVGTRAITLSPDTYNGLYIGRMINGNPVFAWNASAGAEIHGLKISH